MQKRIILQLLGTTLSFLALGVVIDLSQLISEISNLHLLILIIILISTLLRLLICSMRCLRAFSETDQLDLRLTIEGYLVSSYASLFLPTAIGGDAVRVEFLSQRGNLSRARSAAVVLVERVCGLFGMLFLAIMAILYIPTILENGRAYFRMISLCLLILILLAFFVRNLNPIKTSLNWWADFTTSFKKISSPRKFSELVTWSLFAHFAGLAIPFSVGLMHEGGSLDTALKMSAITPIVWLITMLPISLGGNGLREISFVGIADLIGLNEIIALTAALCITVSNILPSIFGAYSVNRWGRKHLQSLE